jgi:hypothetical protein
MIFSKRGIGKTYFMMGLALAVANGEDFGPWRCVNKGRVMYLDAEMTGRSMQSRWLKLNKGRPLPENLIVYSDAYASNLGVTKASILNEQWRDAMEILLLELEIDVLILDNLSSLMPSGDENSKEAWNPVNQWLLRLRFHGLNISPVHHEGKSGDQRGTSGREDNLSMTVHLKTVSGHQQSDGAMFDIVFEKNRDVEPEEAIKLQDLRFQLVNNEWTWAKPKRNNEYGVLMLLRDNPEMSNKDLADNFGLTEERARQIVTKAIDAGYFEKKKKGRRDITPVGEDYLVGSDFND